MKYIILPFALFLAACSQEPPLPVYGQVPQFALTAQSGRPFTRSALDGHVWVADFIYTTCTGPCPLMSMKMSRIQKANPAVRLVSFTVDPDHDTPPVLAAYAKRYNADPNRWFFLTGARHDLNALSRDAFKVCNVDGSLDHSTRLVLMDRQGRIRGYYTEDQDLAKLVRDIGRLEKQSS